MWPDPQFSADLVAFTEEIPNEKLHFLCIGNIKTRQVKIKNSLGNTSDLIFSPWWIKLCKIVKEANTFHQGAILLTRFSPRNSLG